MKLSQLDYHLPPELVAQHPLPDRTGSRLLVLHRDTGRIEHRQFPDICEYLRAPDLLVLNDTRVTPARLFAIRESSGGQVEVFLLEARGADKWRVLTGSGGRLLEGERLVIGGALLATLVAKRPDGSWDVQFTSPTGGDVAAMLRAAARVPLPPYIKRDKDADPYAEQDKERYQTVYARHDGAVAAPTAGLHFTRDLLNKLWASDIYHVFLTLHVGPGTFKPVKADNVADHRIDAERFEVPQQTAREINDKRARGGRCVAVGSTVTRTLESCADAEMTVHAKSGAADLMIMPGHTFRAVDVLLTNFHLPKSSLLALVMAFAGEEQTRAAYRQAIEHRYRFFSYGDAMLVV